MKRTLVLSLLPILWCYPAWADTQISGPAFTTGLDDGRIHISPAFQLPLSNEPPFACTLKTRGAIALDGKAHLCICDESWKLANSNEPCAWTSTAR